MPKVGWHNLVEHPQERPGHTSMNTLGLQPLGCLAQGVSVSGCKPPAPAFVASHAQCPAAASGLGGRLTLEPAGKGPEDPRKATERSLGPTGARLETIRGRLCKHPGVEGGWGGAAAGAPLLERFGEHLYSHPVGAPLRRANPWRGGWASPRSSCPSGRGAPVLRDWHPNSGLPAWPPDCGCGLR